MNEWSTLREFLANRYRADVAICSQRYFAWQFRADASLQAEFATAWDGSRLVGTLGYVGHRTFWGTQEPADAAWLSNWMVDPDYRHGVGIALLREVQQRFGIVLAFGATEENQRIVARLGWTVLPDVPRYLRVFDPKRAQRYLLEGRRRDDLEKARTNSTGAHAHGAGEREWKPTTYRPRWELYTSLRFGTVRSASFLRWRYLEHPAFRFVLLTRGDAERPALCAYRVERAAEGDLVVGRVLEFFHPDDDAGRRDGIALMHAVARRLSAAGCAYADHTTSSAEYSRTLEQVGWFREDPSRPLLPTRLQPIERSGFRMNLEYGSRSLQPPGSTGELYVTRGDGDADRPASLAALG